MAIYGNVIGGTGGGIGKTLSFTDEDGKELFVGTIVEKETKFTATPNDVRVGCTFCSDSGSLIGEKIIPAYHTEMGESLILPNSDFIITFENEAWNYTKLQCIMSPFSKDGIAADKIVVNDVLYLTGSMDEVSRVTKDESIKAIKFNISNTSDTVYYIHYFTYREEY